MHPIHPMAVHFPIALLSASVLFDLLSSRWQSDGLRAASWSMLLLGLGGAVVAVITGAIAEEGNFVVLVNDRMAVRLPQWSSVHGPIPLTRLAAPLTAVRTSRGPWLGDAAWFNDGPELTVKEARTEIVERGPVRVALEITRRAAGSRLSRPATMWILRRSPPIMAGIASRRSIVGAISSPMQSTGTLKKTQASPGGKR